MKKGKYYNIHYLVVLLDEREIYEMVLKDEGGQDKLNLGFLYTYCLIYCWSNIYDSIADSGQFNWSSYLENIFLTLSRSLPAELVSNS